MSLSGGYAVIFLFIAMLVLKKVPKIITHFLWLAVLFRLLCPWSFESAASLLGLGAVAAELLSGGAAGGEIFSALSPGKAVQALPSLPAPMEGPGGLFALGAACSALGCWSGGNTFV